MIYYSKKDKEKIKKYRTNIQKNNNNYSIALSILQDKLQISIKYSEKNSEEILEFSNNYSYHQLQIINKYFRNFNNIESICKDLDKLLKNNKVSIELKNDFIILSIKVLIKKEASNIIFKLLKNKITDFNRSNNKTKGPHALSNISYKNYNNKNSYSMPKYNKKEDNEMKTILSNLNDRVSNLENSRYDSASKENRNINVNNMNDENKIFLKNINSILTRINKLEELNQSKENRIKELEEKIGQFEDNMSNTMSYPIYSIPNKSQKSGNDNNVNNISYIKKKKNNNNSNEYEVEINDNENENKSKKLRSKNKNHIKKKENEYYFKEVEESKDQSNDNIISNKNKSYKDNNSKVSKNTNKKNQNKSKTQENLLKNKILNESIKESENNENKRNKNHNRSSNSSQSDRKSNKKSEEEKTNESLYDYKNNNKKEEEKSSEAEERKKKRRKSNKSNDSNSELLEEKKRLHPKEEKYKKKEKEEEEQKMKEERERKKANTGLEMVEREDLKNYVNSRIFFTRKELQFVKNKVTNKDRHLHVCFEVLYRASIDGDYEEKIKLTCEGIYPQLILFYTEEGARFGVYINKEKHTNFFGSESYKEVEGSSFLISLNSLKTYDILKGKKATDDREEKLCFGRSFYFNDNGSNWFIFTPRNEFLGEKCRIGDKESDFGKIDTSEIVGHIKDYHLKDVEIFKVVFYSDNDDEDENENNNYEKEKKIRNKNHSKERNSYDSDENINNKNTKIGRDDEDED